MAHTRPTTSDEQTAAQMPAADQIEQWQNAWSVIAAGFERGIKCLDPQHPRREELGRTLNLARRAAGLPAESELRSA